MFNLHWMQFAHKYQTRQIINDWHQATSNFSLISHNTVRCCEGADAFMRKQSELVSNRRSQHQTDTRRF